MSAVRTTLAAILTLMSGTAIADTIRVVTLDDLYDQSQPAHLQEVDGDCHYYGRVDPPSTILIEVSVCPTTGGPPSKYRIPL